MAGIAYGTIAASRVSFGTTDVKKISLGTTTIWQSFPSMGVDKTGAQTLPVSTWTTVTGRVVRAGYPDTVITSHGILVPAGVTVALSCQNTHGGSHADNNCRLFNNTTSTVIATSPAGATSTPTVSATYTPPVDSVIVVQGFASSTLSNRSVLSAGAGTFLTVVPV